MELARKTFQISELFDVNKILTSSIKQKLFDLLFVFFFFCRIESEDQLDTAKKPGDRDENNKEDEDCKESNGIDMSEDFDSKLQDIEKRGDDSSEEEQSDNEELDKEMGETEQGADK